MVSITRSTVSWLCVVCILLPLFPSSISPPSSSNSIHLSSLNTPNENGGYNRSLSEYEIRRSVQDSFFNATEGLVNWWRGEGTATDTVGNAPGEFMGEVAYGPGIAGQAFRLNGIDSFINIPDTPFFNFEFTDFTLSFWVNFASIEGEMILIEKWIEKHGPLSEGWTLTKLVDNTLLFAANPGGCSTPLSFIPLNNWINIVVTRSSGNFEIYWNATSLVSASIPYIVPSTSSMKFGHRGNPSDTPGSLGNSGGFFLDGLLDEVRIYNRGMTADEITYHFENLMSPFTSSLEASSNEDLAALAVSGAGTFQEPYILDNWTVKTLGGSGIYIHDTTAHFIIQNCRIETNSAGNGILLENVAPGTAILTNNSCKFNIQGIEIKNSPSTTLLNNWCVQNMDCGIWLLQSGGCTLTKNTATRNYRGIEVTNSLNTILLNNTCNQNSIGGIWLWAGSSNSRVESNRCQNNTYGIHFNDVNNCTILGNYLFNNVQGFLVQSCSETTFLSNYIAFNTVCGTLVRNSVQITLSNNSFIFNGANASISDDWGGSGLSVIDSINGLISNNLFYNNTFTALKFYFSEGFFITSNSFIKNMHGIPPENVSQVYEFTSPLKEANIFSYNFWDDWIQPDEDNDSIVDYPYLLGGNAVNMDFFPLTTPNQLVANQNHLFFLPEVCSSYKNKIFDQEVHISWIEAIDSYGHSITYTLYYSLDNGREWKIIQSNLTSPVYLWDLANITESYECFIKVMAVCSEEQIENTIVFGVFTIDKFAPQVVLDCKSVIHADDPIHLSVRDMSLVSLSCLWDSSIIANTLSESSHNSSWKSFQVAPLSTEGNHTLTITAIDALGRQTTQLFRLYINSPPVIELLSHQNNSILLMNSQISLDILDETLIDVWFFWDFQIRKSLQHPFKVPSFPSRGFHTLTIEAQDSWMFNSTRKYYFYTLGPIFFELTKPPPSMAYARESFITSLRVRNVELIDLILILTIFGTIDEVLEGNNSFLIIPSQGEEIIDIKIRPKHASHHSLTFILFHEGLSYQEYELSFHVSPHWMSPSFLLLLLNILTMLFIVVASNLLILRYYLRSRFYWSSHARLNQLIDQITLSNLELREIEDLANGSTAPSNYPLGSPQRLYQRNWQPPNREILERRFHVLHDEIKQRNPINKEKLSKLLNECEELLCMH